MRALPRLCEFYPGICLTTEEKERKNLSQGKKNLSQVKKNLSQVKKNLSQVKKNLSQVKKNLSQVKKNLSQVKKNLSQVKKNLSQVKKTSGRVQYTFTKAPTHYKTLTHTHTHITKPTHTHTRARAHIHITKQYKTTIVQIKTKCNRKSNTKYKIYTYQTLSSHVQFLPKPIPFCPSGRNLDDFYRTDPVPA